MGVKAVQVEPQPRLRIPCAAPPPLTDEDRATLKVRCRDIDALAEMYTGLLGPGALILCPLCKAGDPAPVYPETGCAQCFGKGYAWAIEGGDEQGGWAVVDWSGALTLSTGEYGGAVSGEALHVNLRQITRQGANRR